MVWYCMAALLEEPISLDDTVMVKWHVENSNQPTLTITNHELCSFYLRDGPEQYQGDVRGSN